MAPAQGHSKGTKRGSEAFWRRALLVQTPGWTSPPAGSLLTFFLLHVDGSVGEDGGVSLQGVVVRAIVLLVLERAVLAGLLCREGTVAKSSGPGKAWGAAPHARTRGRAHRRHTTRVCTQLRFSRYLSSALPPSGSGGGTRCSSLSCCLFPRPGSERSPGCSRTQPGSPEQRRKVGWSGDSPRGARNDITSERQSWRGNAASSPQFPGKVKKRNHREQAANEGFISPGAQRSQLQNFL